MKIIDLMTHRLAVKAIAQQSADVRSSSLSGALLERGHERGTFQEEALPADLDLGNPMSPSVARQRELDQINEFMAQARITSMTVARLKARMHSKLRVACARHTAIA